MGAVFYSFLQPQLLAWCIAQHRPGNKETFSWMAITLERLQLESPSEMGRGLSLPRGDGPASPSTSRCPKQCAPPSVPQVPDPGSSIQADLRGTTGSVPDLGKWSKYRNRITQFFFHLPVQIKVMLILCHSLLSKIVLCLLKKSTWLDLKIQKNHNSNILKFLLKYSWFIMLC